MLRADAWSSERTAGSLLLLVVGALLLGGCDGGGAKRASLYQRLVNGGTWTAERLQETGDFEIDHTDRLNERYSWVRFTFEDGDDGRTYRVTGRRTSDTTIVLAEGPVKLGGDQLLRMVPGARGFETPNGRRRSVTWTFRFQATRAIFRLPPDRSNGSRAFLSTLLPQRTWSETQGVRLQLAPEEDG